MTSPARQPGISEEPHDPVPNRFHRPVRLIDGVPHYGCSRCPAWKPEEGFFKTTDGEGVKRLRSECKTCTAESRNAKRCKPRPAPGRPVKPLMPNYDEAKAFERARREYQARMGNPKALVPTSCELKTVPPRDVYIPAPSRHGRDWDDDV